MYRFHKAQTRVFHQKTNRRTMRAATKTVVELFGGADGKTGGFFIVKWAAGRIIGARFFKRNAFIYHVHNIDAVQKLLNKLLWNHNR